MSISGEASGAMQPSSPPSSAAVPKRSLDRPRETATTDQVISYLLSNSYLLTALELLLEAYESGRDAEVAPLSAFFGNRALFPPEALASYSGEAALDFARVATNREDCIALLRYELRLAREDVRELRNAQRWALARRSVEEVGGEADQAAEGDEREGSGGGDAVEGPESLPPAASPRQASGEKAAAEQVKSAPDAPESLSKGDEEASAGTPTCFRPSSSRASAAREDFATPAERRAVNAAVRQYLERMGYRMTAMTFREEAGSSTPPRQRWTRGPPPPAPPSLPEALRALDSTAALSAELERCQGEREAVAGELRGCQDLLESAREAEQAALAKLEQAEAELTYVQAKVRAFEELQDGDAGTREEESRELPSPTALSTLAPPPPPPPSLPTVWSTLDAAAEGLQALLPHVLIAQRELAAPALAALCREHPRPEVRAALAESLFSMIKRPVAEQRAGIVRAYASLARQLAPPRAALELLPPLARHVEHDCTERRLLVGEAALELAPLVPPSARRHTLLHLCAHLCSDPEAEVRRQAVRSLAGLCRLLAGGTAGEAEQMGEGEAAESQEDAEEKETSATPRRHLPIPASPSRASCQPLVPTRQEALDLSRSLAALLADPAPAVAEEAQRLLSPAVLAFLAASPRASRALGARALRELEQILERSPFVPGTPLSLDGARHSELRAPAEAARARAAALLRVLRPLFKILKLQALRTAPAWARGEGDAGSAPEASASVDGASGGSPTREPWDGRVDEAGSDSDWDAVSRDGGDCEGQAWEENSRLATSENSASPLDAWALDERGRRWAVPYWTARVAVPRLAVLARRVAPSPDCLPLREALLGALKALCLEFGRVFALQAVEPCVAAAAEAPLWRPRLAGTPPPSRHVRPGAVAPASPQAAAAAHAALLPLLLAGVLPYCGPQAVRAQLEALTAVGPRGGAGEPTGPTGLQQQCWALRHPQAFVEALRFAAQHSPSLQGPMLDLVTETVGRWGGTSMDASTNSPPSDAASAHRTVAALALGALAPCLPARTVARRALPLLASILDGYVDRDGLGAQEDEGEEGLRKENATPLSPPSSSPPPPHIVAALAATVATLTAFAADEGLQSGAVEVLETFASAGPRSAAAMLCALAPAARALGPAALEWALQCVLLHLATLAGVEGRGGLPRAAFYLLCRVDAERFDPGSRVALHHRAALEALERLAEGELGRGERDVLRALREDLAAAAGEGEEGEDDDDGLEPPSPLGAGHSPSKAWSPDQQGATREPSLHCRGPGAWEGMDALDAGKVFRGWSWAAMLQQN